MLILANTDVIEGEWMYVTSFIETQADLESILDRVVDDANITIITREDAGDAVVMSMSYYTSLMETLHLLRSPENSSHLSRSISQYRASSSVG